jgi:hypothetical protein
MPGVGRTLFALLRAPVMVRGLWMASFSSLRLNEVHDESQHTARYV